MEFNVKLNKEQKSKYFTICQYYNIGDRYIVEFSIGEFDIKNIELFEGDVVSYTSKDLDPTPAIIVYSRTSFSTKCTVSGDLGDIYGFKLKKIGDVHMFNNKNKSSYGGKCYL